MEDSKQAIDGRSWTLICQARSKVLEAIKAESDIATAHKDTKKAVDTAWSELGVLLDELATPGLYTQEEQA